MEWGGAHRAFIGFSLLAP